MELIGKTTIHPFVFYTGKIAGYISWLVIVLAYLNIPGFQAHSSLSSVSICFFVLGLIFIVMSSIYLGKSMRVGLPKTETILKTKGIYKISRNPMYLGFDLLTIASMIGNFSWMIGLLGIYSMIVYHFIIKGEELFLLERFGHQYNTYMSKVNRYFGVRRDS